MGIVIKRLLGTNIAGKKALQQTVIQLRFKMGGATKIIDKRPLCPQCSSRLNGLAQECPYCRARLIWKVVPTWY